MLASDAHATWLCSRPWKSKASTRKTTKENMQCQRNETWAQRLRTCFFYLELIKRECGVQLSEQSSDHGHEHEHEHIEDCSLEISICTVFLLISTRQVVYRDLPVTALRISPLIKTFDDHHKSPSPKCRIRNMYIMLRKREPKMTTASSSRHSDA